MGIYAVEVKYTDGSTSVWPALHADSYDIAYERVERVVTKQGNTIVGAVVASAREPENYTIYGEGV